MAAVKMFEFMKHKSFYDIKDGDIDDAKDLMYCCLVANNEEFKISREAFENLFLNQKFVVWISREMELVMQQITQFTEYYVADDEDINKPKEDEEKPKISELADDLVVSFGMDPHYVNFEMRLYEMMGYLKAAERCYKNELEEKRLFSYLGNMANFKKRMKLEDYLPFSWEKEDKIAKAKKDLKINKAAILATFKKMNENGKGLNDNNLGQGELPDGDAVTATAGECGQDFSNQEQSPTGNAGDSQSGKGEPCDDAQG